jgi:hypothetical protein
LPARARAADLGLEQLAPRCDRQFLALAIAVGAFAEHVIEPGGAFGIAMEGLVFGAKVARAQHPRPSRLELDRGRAQDVSGVPQSGAKAGGGFEPLLQLHGRALPPGGEGIGFGIERGELFLPGAVAAAVAALGIGLLDPPGIGEHVFEQIGGRLSAPDPAAEAFGHQPRQEPRMVDVGVGQHHRIDLAWVEAEGAGVQALERTRALEHPAIDQHSRRAEGEFVARTRHRARGTVEGEGQFMAHVASLPLRGRSAIDLAQANPPAAPGSSPARRALR